MVAAPASRERVRATLDHREPDRIPLDLLGCDGFVFAAVHNVQPNVPPENLVAMWETWREEAANGQG